MFFEDNEYHRTEIKELVQCVTRESNKVEIKDIPLTISRKFFDNFFFIQKLVLSNCQLNKFPRSILRLTNLEFLDLSKNRLKVIPIEIGNLKNLGFLEYENNECRPFADFITCKRFKNLLEASKYVMERQNIKPPVRQFIPFDQKDTFKILSYNILSTKYAIQDIYPLCTKESLDFTQRFSLILKEVQEYQPNIVCLQEVQAGLFDSHFSPAFESLGYSSLYAPKDYYYKAKPEVKDLVIGQATFIKKNDIFTIKCDSKISFNKSKFIKQGKVPKKTKKYSETAHIIELELKNNECNDIDSHTIILVNTHLNWKNTGDDIRADQLKIAIAHAIEIAKGGQNDRNSYDIVICGDYNSYPDTEAIAIINSHPEKFVSSYDAMKQPFNLSHLTCDFDGCIDYIYTTQNKIEVASVLPLYTNEILYQIALEIPDKYHPSDHLPVAAALRLKKD